MMSMFLMPLIGIRVGTGPRDLAVYDNELYVACEHSSDVYVFDGTDWTNTGFVGSGPYGLSVYDNKLYCICYGWDKVYAFDGNTWVESGNVGDKPKDIKTYGANLYVACYGSDNVYVFDGSNWTISGAVGTGPRGLAVHNNKLYVTCYDSNDVYVFDGIDWTNVGAVGSGPIGLATYDNKLYAACYGSHDVYVFDAPDWNSTGATPISGAYSYKITYRNYQGFESNASLASNVETISLEQCKLTGIPLSSDLQVVERRIYRTEAGGTTYKFLTTIEDNVTVIYFDAIADSSLGATLETDHDVPEVMSEVHSHKSLLRGIEAARKNIVWCQTLMMSGNILTCITMIPLVLLLTKHSQLKH